MSAGHDYARDGAEIYRRSFAIIRSEADLARFSPDEAASPCESSTLAAWWRSPATSCSPPASSRRRVARCCRHADLLRFEDGGERHHPRPASGQNEIICTLAIRDRRAAPRVSAPRAPPPPLTFGAIGSAGALVAIGNAPTALFRLLELLDAGAPKPAAVIGMPVGFVGAAESKEALAAHGSVPFLIVRAARAAAPWRSPPSTRSRARLSDGHARHTLRRRRRPRRPRADVAEGCAHPQERACDRLFRQEGQRRQCAPHRRRPAQPASRARPPRLSLYHRACRDRPVLSRRARRLLRCERSDARGQARRRPGRRGDLRRRSLLLRLLCASARAPRRHASLRGHPRHHRHERLLDQRLDAHDLRRRDAGRALRHHGVERAGRAARVLRSRGDHEGRPQPRQDQAGARPRRQARSRRLCRARHHAEERIVQLADKPDDQAAYFAVVLVPGERKPL